MKSQLSLISPLSVAPMIDWTYNHFRVLMRLIAPKALLYTEMQTVGAIRNKPQSVLAFDPMESPLALQLGGANKAALVDCAKIAEAEGFVEINLNLGCPSDKVQSGRFGACLMMNSEAVAECIHAMKSAVCLPVTAKTRIGIDNHDSYEFFSAFARDLVSAGCDKLIVHARKAWLNGLSPKQNRTIPPLHYDYVYRIKSEYPDLPIVINGNIRTIKEIETHVQQVDGVMLGRLACQDPYALASIHHYFYPDSPIRSREAILQEYFDYARQQFHQGVPLSRLFKPVYNIFHGLPGVKRWKERLMQIQQSKKMTDILLNLG